MDENLKIEESILKSIKEKLGASKDRNVFDQVIMDYINATLLPLSQMGVGKEGFIVTSEEQKWSDFMPASNLLNYIIPYMYLSTKLLFDPPTSSVALDSIKNLIDRYESRINFEVDVMSKLKKEEPTNGVY